MGAVYGDLRSLALDAVSSGLPPPRSDHPHVSGVVVYIPMEHGYASVVSLTDDTTSMYTSTGGGTIGAGSHVAVAAATHALLASIDEELQRFPPGEDAALPPPGTVRFHVLAPDGGRTCDVHADSFWGKTDHPLRPVIAAVQGVISSFRAVSPE